MDKIIILWSISRNPCTDVGSHDGCGNIEFSLLDGKSVFYF